MSINISEYVSHKLIGLRSVYKSTYLRNVNQHYSKYSVSLSYVQRIVLLCCASVVAFQLNSSTCALLWNVEHPETSLKVVGAKCLNEVRVV